MRSSNPGYDRGLGSKPPQTDHNNVEDEEEEAEPELARRQFQFIGETGLSRPKGDALRLIRSRARRSHSNIGRRRTSMPKQRQQLLQLRRHTELDSSEERSKSAGTRVSGLPVPREINPRSDPSSTVIDPFGTLGVGEGGQLQYLIGQFASIFYPNERAYTPIRPYLRKEEALESSLSDPAHLHASLTHVSKSLTSLTNVDFSPNMMYHLGKSIAIINMRIADPKAVTRETICAVTTVTGVELRIGSMASVKIHLDGLEALVKIVGGLQALVNGSFAFKYILLIDIVSAIVLGLKPRFEELANSAFLPLDPDLDYLEPENLLAARYKTRLSNLTRVPDISQEMIEVYRRFRHLITKKEIIASSHNMEIPEAEFLSLQAYCTHLMYRLIALIQYNAMNFNSLVFRLFGNAAVAHILMFTYNMPPHTDTHVLMSTRIKACLEMIDVQGFQTAYPELTLWVTLIGGLCSVGTNDQLWFIQLLAQLCSASGVAGTTELSLSLTEFLWSDFYLGPIFDEFWNEFAETQLALKVRQDNQYS